MLNKNRKAVAFLSIICLVISCNQGIKNETKSVIATMPDSLSRRDPFGKAPSIELSADAKMNLLKHFPDNDKFPVIIDSAYMAQVNKHDSLGAKELKMLARFWHDDELFNEEDDSMEVLHFYQNDSLKAYHLFKGQYTEGKPTYSNAYGLQKINVREETLLIWALVSKQEDADPIYRLTTVYYTILNNNTILETSIMGRLMIGMDPPGEYRTILSGTLASDGKLGLDQHEFTGDMDSLKGELKHTHYEYFIHQGYTQLTNKKADSPKEIKLKN